ncbi:hypothetical protein GCK72_024968 [Caenorhabditis remanei]|uniref:Uncharacterized protein n=1 Tax=Caenorhabditis remanei TaxID=31234 RepID=A0A6A5G170_CAERE|nr:hypothetical protein GCK72_024968 [Caenorhabditis remanei]KAF1748501.1 hypothetical protein GCK72_024968 [Caenorhabditis remanei]
MTNNESIQSADSLVNGALFQHLSKTRIEKEKMMKETQFNMDECWTRIADDLYHRTCNYLEDKTPKTNKLHAIVRDIRMGHKHRLEFILPRATQRYKAYTCFILFESLHLCLQTEGIALYYLDRIRKEEEAAQTASNAVVVASSAPTPNDCTIL